MDAKAPLTKTTLERTLNTLHLFLPGVLEKGKTIEPDQVDGFLIDALFSIAVYAGWIEAPISQWGPEDQYFLKPEFRSSGPYPATVELGGFKVPEKTHDDFITLFWSNRPEFIAAKNDALLASIGALLDSGVDTLADLRSGENTIPKAEQPSDTIHRSSNAAVNTPNPAQLLINGKTHLGVTWAKLAKMAGKHLQRMADEEMKDLEDVTGKVKVELKVDAVFRLLRGQNIRPDNAKALAAVLDIDWRLLVWPTKQT
ncbi:MAG TPA: hypothetical protein VK752_11160 [Bryobacteraceae bacterium]|jgi:hypothetical protein|nr:hypothetical protein [Bryobacteraceae bacterium]